MQFAQPIWLVVAGAVILLLILAFRHFRQIQLKALKEFASEHLLPILTANLAPRLRQIKFWLLTIGMSLCIISLARPQIGFHWEEAKRKGIDILFAVDTSRSMLAQDVNPDRLTRAKLAVLDLLDKLQGDRVGLIAFAGSSFLQCPLTLDHDAFRQSVEALDTTVIPLGGTNLASAIREAETAFSLGHPSHKILVFITDGEDLEANGIVAAKEAAQREVRIFTVGVGTSAGELIPIRNESGRIEFLKDENGQTVKSHLDESTLRQIAEVTGGFYEPLGQQGQGLEAIYERGLAPIPKQELSSRMNKVYIERFQWSLAAGILCLILEMLLGDRKRKKTFVIRWPKFKTTLSTLFLFLIFYPLTSEASPQNAEKAYQQGNFKEALLQYKSAVEKNPKKPELQFNLGAAAYKNSQFTEAVSAFQKALITPQIPLQQQTFYNLGNTQYRLGQQTEKTNPQQTIQSWQQALQSYESAIKLKADDSDAKFNYELVKKKLEELQKQQPKDDSKDQKENKDSNKDSKSQSSQSDKTNKDQENKNSKEQKNPTQQNPRKQETPAKPSDEQKQQPQQSANQEKKQAQQQQQEKEPQPLPGQMNREEAKNLLDSLKGDEKKMPASLIQPDRPNQQENTPKHDW